MPKKTLTGIAAALAFLATACICLPTDLLSYVIAEPTRAPAPTYAAGKPSASVEDLPACMERLEQALYEAADTYYEGLELHNEFTLVTYTVSGQAITDPEYATVPGRIAYLQEDAAWHEEVWRFVADVIPADQRARVAFFVLYTDGVGGSLGAVEQTDDPHFWILELDLEDARNFPDLATTVVHELGHLITLEEAQIPTDLVVFNNPEDEQIYQQRASACDTYFVFEGCSRPDSYINVFFERYWFDIYDQWLDFTDEEDQRILDENLEAFYQNYADQFVSDYAATSPEEDIAETFMHFVFAPQPSGLTIADQKVLFFYEYPELVDLRTRLLPGLCAHLP